MVVKKIVVFTKSKNASNITTVVIKIRNDLIHEKYCYRLLTSSKYSYKKLDTVPVNLYLVY